MVLQHPNITFSLIACQYPLQVRAFIGSDIIDLIYAELSGDFPLGDSRQPTYKSLRPFDLVS